MDVVLRTSIRKHEEDAVVVMVNVEEDIEEVHLVPCLLELALTRAAALVLLRLLEEELK